MLNLEHPTQKGYLSGDELRCLAKALGYASALFEIGIHDGSLWTDGGMLVQDLYRALDYKLLHEHLHQIFNIHSDEWNVKLIRKAVSCVDRHVYWFSELQQIRLAFETYEQQDSRGLAMIPDVMLATLKMCGRVISPKKLMHRLKHKRGQFESPDHIQLCELLDLLLWCVRYEHFEYDGAPRADGTDTDRLFHLVNFKSLLQDHDRRQTCQLDHKFWKDERDFGEVPSRFDDVITLHDLPVLKYTCDNQIEESKNENRALKSALNKSETRVKSARNGGHPDITTFNISHIIHSCDDARAGKRDSMDGHKMLHSYVSLNSRSNASRDRPKRKVPAATSRTPTPSYVTPSDLHDTNSKICDLQYQMCTVEGRYKQIRERDMAVVIPGYTLKHYTPPESDTKEVTIKDLIHDHFKPHTQRHKTKSAPPVSRLHVQGNDVSKTRPQSSTPKKTRPSTKPTQICRPLNRPNFVCNGFGLRQKLTC